MALINDLYYAASIGDYDGFASGIFITSLYALFIGFSVLEFMNKRK